MTRRESGKSGRLVIWLYVTILTQPTPYSSDEQLRYQRLLHRYLVVKYSSADEAAESYTKLLANVEEMRAINVDVFNMFHYYSELIQDVPLFKELLDVKGTAISVNAFGILV